MKLICFLILIYTLTSSIELSAAGKYKKRRRARPKPKKTIIHKSLSYIDETQSFISSAWKEMNYSIDSYFADEKYKKSKNRSWIKASYLLFKKESSDLNSVFDIRTRLHFPRVSKKLNIVLEKERDEIGESQNSTSSQAQASKADNFNAGVSYILYRSKFWKTSLDTGMRIELPLNPYAKFKIYNKTTTRFIDIYISQKFIFYRQDGFSEISQISFSKKFFSVFSISQNNSLSWSDDDKIFTLRNSLNINHTLTEKKSISFNIGATAPFSPKFEYTSYDTSIAYNQIMYKKWILGQVSVGGDFQKSNDFKMQNFILFRLEVLFK